MVVHAHPDDAEFVCGGTIAKLADAGVEWTVVVCTQGNRGGEGERTPEDLAAVREREQRRAADIMGVKRLLNLGYDDGSLTPSLELRRDITRVLRQYRPNLVIVANPVRNFGSIGGNHPDHLAAGEAALAAIYPTARNPMALPELMEEGLEKWAVEWVWVAGANQVQPNLYVDITTTIQRKVEALQAHESQLGDWVNGYARGRARAEAEAAAEAGLGDFEYAEAFVKMFTAELNTKEAVAEAARLYGPYHTQPRSRGEVAERA
ncbi:MAG: hypothetical protein QOE92_584 [Chloroflexota bacterium]|nr:hypothetical protein [Chloroflexota bacterium]